MLVIRSVESVNAVTSIPIEDYLIDESHYIVSIRNCPSCSQRYLPVTTEIFRTIIPIDDEERASLIANSPPKTSVLEAISPGRRSLKYAWQKGEQPSTYWGAGVQVGLND